MDHSYSTSRSERPPQDDADRAFYRDALHEMIEAGLAVTRVVRLQAEALSDVSDPGSEGRVRDVERVAAAFERVSRSVRFCIAQAERLDQPLRPVPAVRETLYGPDRKRERELTVADLHKLSDAELRAAKRERQERERAEDLMVDRPIEEVFGVILKDLEAAVLALADHPGAAELQAVQRTVGQVRVGVTARAQCAAAAPRGGEAPLEAVFRDTG